MKRLQRIRKGCHYPLDFVIETFRYFGISRKNRKNTISRRITFNEDCRYIIDGVDQWDWSKLYGFCFGITGIHKNSVRFGWRYNPKTEKIEVCRILYYGNPVIHKMEYLTSVEVGSKHEYTIVHEIEGDIMHVTMYIDDEKWETSINRPPCRLRFGSGLYFGGNQKAPQEVSIIVE